MDFKEEAKLWVRENINLTTESGDFTPATTEYLIEEALKASKDEWLARAVRWLRGHYDDYNATPEDNLLIEDLIKDFEKEFNKE